MIIKQPGAKRTNYKIVCFKCLVNRWRLVYPASDGFKIMNGKNIRIAAAIPANHIKWMSAIMQTVEHPFLFCLDKKIAFFIKCLKILWPSYIPFAIRGMLHQLTIFTYILLWIADRAE